MITDRIDNYLNEDEELLETDDYDYVKDTEIINRMFEFLTTLNHDNLSEDEKIEIVDIINELAGEEIDEATSAKRVKIKPAEKRKRKRLYRKAKAKIKLAARRFRRTAAFKAWKRLRDRKKKSGKTARGKRIRTFI